MRWGEGRLKLGFWQPLQMTKGSIDTVDMHAAGVGVRCHDMLNVEFKIGG